MHSPGGDAGQSQRQLHVLPARGPAAAHTGSACVDWCGHRLQDDLSVAGNMLAGPRVVEATAEAFTASAGQSLALRLISAMQAGEAAGGDKRGKQSIALRIQGHQDYPELDLRVDDHPEPLAELQRLHDKSLERFQPFIACLATRERPAGESDRQPRRGPHRAIPCGLARPGLSVALLEVTDLSTRFRTEGGEFAAVDGISFSVEAGKTLAIVGESGCGKSVTSLSIMGLVGPAGRGGRRLDPV
jgi:ABC-type multidrug transport system fused ATPase/permease subunit